MEDNPKRTHSPASSNEIDDLLAEAEALSNEITSGAVATIEAPPEPLRAEQFSIGSNPPVVSGEAPAILEAPAEPMQAVDEVQNKVDDLKDLLNDPDAGSPAHGAKIMAPNTVVEKPKGNRKGSKFNLPKREVEAPIESIAPEPTTVEPKNDAETIATEAAETPATATAMPVAAGSAITGMKRFIGKLVRGALGGMKSVVAVVLNSVLAVLAVLDWPFRALSPRVKNAVGLAGLVTLMMGLMSWILPGMMHSNPFEKMDLGIAREGGNPPAAAEGHGEEGHGGEAAPAAEHGAPPPAAAAAPAHH